MSARIEKKIEDEIIRLYDNGMNGYQISQKINKQNCVVYRILKRNGRDTSTKLQVYKKCNIEGCGNQTNRVSGLCDKHYQRQRKYGEPNKRLTCEKGLRMDNLAEYSVWVGMKKRCQNQNHPGYKHYGGRGIRICEEWLGVDGFQTFLKDMGGKPSAEYQIDRINNNGNYEPSNCRWVLPVVNVRNSRSTKLNPQKVMEIRRLYSEGKKRKELAKLYGITPSNVSVIINNKSWSK